MLYKQSPGRGNKFLYFAAEETPGEKRGPYKMIKRSEIPEDILSTMQPEKEITDQAPEFRKCPFCGSLGTEGKWLNGDIHYLCLDDYQSRTTGELAERLVRV